MAKRRKFSILDDLRTVVFPAAIQTPGGVITVQGGDEDEEDGYPGYSVHINGRIAAVVEWHAEYQCFVLRTYTYGNDEPIHYHTWDGKPLPL